MNVKSIVCAVVCAAAFVGFAGAVPAVAGTAQGSSAKAAASPSETGPQAMASVLGDMSTLMDRWMAKMSDGKGLSPEEAKRMAGAMTKMSEVMRDMSSMVEQASGSAPQGAGNGQGMMGNGRGQGMMGNGQGQGMMGNGQGQGMMGNGQGQGMMGNGRGMMMMEPGMTERMQQMHLRMQKLLEKSTS